MLVPTVIEKQLLSFNSDILSLNHQNPVEPKLRASEFAFILTPLQ